MTNDRAPLYKSSIYFSTGDAHTLTDGPMLAESEISKNPGNPKIRKILAVAVNRM